MPFYLSIKASSNNINKEAASFNEAALYIYIEAALYIYIDDKTSKICYNNVIVDLNQGGQ